MGLAAAELVGGVRRRVPVAANHVPHILLLVTDHKVTVSVQVGVPWLMVVYAIPAVDWELLIPPLPKVISPHKVMEWLYYHVENDNVVDDDTPGSAGERNVDIVHRPKESGSVD